MNDICDSYVEDNFEQVLNAFNDCGWETVLGDVSDEGYTSMSQALHEAATKAYDVDKQARGKVLQLLAEACSMMLSPENRNDPFEPIWVGGGTRSTISDDFTEAEIRLLHEIIESIDRPLLKGRLSDLVWVKNKSLGVKNALHAIDSYRQLPLDVDTWFSDGERCWERAIDLSRMIGPTAGDRLDQMERSIIEALKLASAKDKFFSYGLAHTLRSNGLGESDATMVAEKLESLAGEFREAGDFHASESFYNASVNWYKHSGDDDKSIDMIVAQAESFIDDATARLSSDSPSYGVAASFLEDAIQVYRSIPRDHRDRHDVDKRIQELRLLLNEHGKRALDEMATVSGSPIDFSDGIEQARDAVSGKSVQVALWTFANLYHVSAKKLRESAIENLSRTPFLASIPKVYSSHDGRVIARTPGISASTPSEDDEAEILAQMNRVEYGTLVSIIVQALILPALDVLTLEHRLRTADLIDLARRSPIVPIGREVLFSKALAEGFNRDFATSIHLLAPQIEHMVRIPLKAAGVSTSHLDQDGIETENGLSALIDLPQTKAIFGEDLTYEIKALFCDQMGPNLRNNIAHGLLNDQEVQSVDAIYAWWLGLKLVLNSFWNSLDRETVKEQQQEASEEDSV